MRRLLLALCFTALTFGVGAATPPHPSWEFLSTSTVGADRFITAHPEWDGRGVLIAVCDSGVELGLPGLAETSDGKPKVLDARDFSSEGRIDLEPAERSEDAHGAAWHSKDGRWLYGAGQLNPAVADGAQVLVGYFYEKNLRGADISDLNNNGRSDDVYGVVAYRPAGSPDDGPWVAFVDTNADGDLTGETPLYDFGVTRQTFHLGGHDRHAQADLVTIALNLWPKEKRAAFFFADNAHGTHVAGIAAGYRLDGQAGFNGIAPGAQLLALKIGSGTLSGGATTPGSMLAAWRYAVKRAAELDMPLVIQMSYGVGSEDEGTGVAERLIDSLLADHPEVTATVSAGNEGPGVSTVGLPAAAHEVMAVGAALARSTAAVVYGYDLPHDRMFSFSSRGGELAKPDIVAPGFASSSVPDWERGDVFRGTSMAAPQMAGACALLDSAALASRLPIRRSLVRAAYQRTARALPGYGPLDQGPGMADVPAAWEAYRRLAARGADVPVGYTVSTPSPEMPDGKGPAVFYRGDFYPRPPHLQVVKITPDFSADTPDPVVRRFYQGLDLEGGADWVAVDKKQTYVKQARAAEIPLRFRPEALTRPGLYQTRILAYDHGMSREDRKTLGPEIAFPVAVAVPVAFDGQGRARQRLEHIGPAEVGRVFFRVAPWIGGVTATVKLPEDVRDRNAAAYLFDPEGRRVELARLGAKAPEATFDVGPTRPDPGVWELDVVGGAGNRGDVGADVELLAFPLAVATADTVTVHQPAGSAPSATVEVTSGLDAIWHGRGTGMVVGARGESHDTVRGVRFTRKLSLAPEESELDLTLEMPPADWSLFTDVAVRVLDADGDPVLQDGFTYRRLSFTFRPPAAAAPGAVYTLEVLPATADPDVAEPEWHLTVRETRRYREEVPVAVSQDDGPALTLYPDHPAELALALARTPPRAPEGFNWLARLDLLPDDPSQPQLHLEVNLK